MDERQKRCFNLAGIRGARPGVRVLVRQIWTSARYGTVARIKRIIGGMLIVLAAGKASDATRAILKACGPRQLLQGLRFFGLGRAKLIAAQSISWEDDPWAGGAYAYFDSSFPPVARRLLRLPWKRIFFVGEHTSSKWQGYMNGAVESGLRAAEEILGTGGLSVGDSK